jgi:hypothetical protein
MTQGPPSPKIKTGFPFWDYLCQPLFHSTTVLNPFRFWYCYQLKAQDPVSFLEQCWTLNYKAKSEEQPMDRQ